jgi:hypothetical protein
MSRISNSMYKIFFLFGLLSITFFQSLNIVEAKTKIKEKDIQQNSTTSADKRFIDNGDETITDTKTNLMWMKQDSYLRSGHWLHWFESIKYVKNLNEEQFANYMDWDLPSIEELKSLYEPEKLNSSQIGREMKIYIDPIFAKKGSGGHWSGEKNGVHSAFGLIYNNGSVFSHPKKSRARKAVRAVRRLP